MNRFWRIVPTDQQLQLPPILANSDLLQHETTLALATLCRVSDQVLDQFEVPDRFRLTLKVADDNRVNAMVWRQPRSRRYEIRFNAGLIIFSACLAADLCKMSEAGFSAESAQFRNTQLFHEQSENGALEAVIAGMENAFDRRQIGFWRSSFGTMLLVVLVHEMAHVFRGHLDLLSSGTDAGFRIDELGMRDGRIALTSVPVRAIEVDADRAGAQLFSRMAISCPEALDWWARNEIHESMFLALLMHLMFILQTETQASAFKTPTNNYPSSMLRITLMVSQMGTVWQEEYTGHETLEESVLEPVLHLLAQFEQVMPHVDVLRGFTDTVTQQQIIAEADLTLSLLETDLTSFKLLLFARCENSRW